MTLYINPYLLAFAGGFVAGWLSLIALVYGTTAMQRRRNRRTS
jgi:hypothetical protein